VKDTPIQNSTLLDIATVFITTLPAQKKEVAQSELRRFIRWLGSHQKPSKLSPVDISSYGELITLSSAKLIKPFLTYLHRQGLTTINLAPHLRAKKPPQKRLPHSRQRPPNSAILTTTGHANMKAELSVLKSQRIQITREIHKAAEDKDFKENAPLEAAREQKSLLEGRIQELETTLMSATIIKDKQNSSQITIGSTVILHNLDSGEKHRYTMVDPKEANPMSGKLSIASPLGKVISGKNTGETVELTAPAGTFHYTIEDIL